MEVKLGSKQAEGGVIPENWEIARLEELCVSNGLVRGPFGGTLTKAIFVNSGYKVYEQRNAIYRDATLGRYYIDDEKFNELKRFELQEGDFIVSCSGTIGKIFQLPKDIEPGVINQALLKIKTDEDKILDKFFFYYFDWEKFQARIIDNTQGGAMPNLVGMNVFRSIPIPLPPLPEQRAIATALSDVDALLTALDALIAKNRLITQGAMQELLTGKMRLPGFSGEWEEQSVPEICWFQEGPGVRTTQFTSSGVKLLNGTNIFRGNIDLDSTNRFISIHEAYGPYSHFLADAGDIVIASSGITVERFDEKVAFVKEEHLPLCMNTSTIRFKANKEKLDTLFLYYLLMSGSFKKQIGSQATGSAQLNFGPAHIKKVSFGMPGLDEQTAIAEITSDMDAEIQALEQRREKTRLLKQGMMQELLTGGIRLV